jgi:hypothetical protein
VQHGCGGQAGAIGAGQQGCATGAATSDCGMTVWVVGTTNCCGAATGAGANVVGGQGGGGHGAATTGVAIGCGHKQHDAPRSKSGQKRRQQQPAAGAITIATASKVSIFLMVLCLLRKQRAITASVALSDFPIQTCMGGLPTPAKPDASANKACSRLLPGLPESMGIALESIVRGGRLSNSTSQWAMCNRDR